MRARLEALGADGRRAPARSTPRRSASCATSRRSRSARSSRRRRCRSATSGTRCRGRTSSGPRPTSRPRSSGRRTAGSRPARLPRRALGDHEPPIPADLMAARLPAIRAAQGATQGYVDFEDLLELAIRLFDDDATRARAAARPLPRVHGRRVPGREPAAADAARPLARRRATSSASSATTTSRSTPSPARARAPARRCRSGFPSATVVRLEENYRSTPEVLEFANRLVPRLGGAEKVLRATRPGGPKRRSLGPSATPRTEAAFIVERMRELHAAGTPLRGDGDALPHERALGRLRGGADRGQDPVQGACAPDRDGARQLLKALRGSGGSVADCVRSRSSRGCSSVTAGQARRARADAPERPGAARAPRRRVRRRRRAARVRRRARASASAPTAGRAASTS